MKPIIYQLLPRLFGNYNETRQQNGSREVNGCGKMADITPKALKSIRDLGATHVWYTGVIRHATAERNTPSITKGLAGSPYAITDYYDIDPDIAKDEDKRMAEFEALVARTHRQGLDVIIDFVPNHVAREYKSLCKPAGVKDLGEGDNPDWAFSPLNNFYYIPGETFQPEGVDLQGYTEFPARATGNDCFGAHPGRNDWYETVKLNYGVFYQGGEKQFNPIPNTWFKMRDILLYWADKKVDGFRVDMAEMVPVEFWSWVIPQVKEASKQPLLFIAECYNPGLYDAYIQAGFDYLYDKVGMYDYLRGITSKGWSADGITHQWMSRGDNAEHMLYFLENHDEQRIASGFFCGRGRCAEPAMIVAATLNTCPVMVYMGQELGEKGMDAEGFSGMDGRTTIFDYWGVRSLQAWANKGKFDGKNLDEEQSQLRLFYQRLLTLARDSKVLTEGRMYDIEYAQAEGFNRQKEFAFLRHHGNETLLIIVNFHDREEQTRIRIPADAFVYLGAEEKDKCSMTDLLTGETIDNVSFTSDAPIHLTLPAWTGKILRING